MGITLVTSPVSVQSNGLPNCKIKCSLYWGVCFWFNLFFFYTSQPLCCMDSCTKKIQFFYVSCVNICLLVKTVLLVHLLDIVPTLDSSLFTAPSHFNVHEHFWYLDFCPVFSYTFEHAFVWFYVDWLCLVLLLCMYCTWIQLNPVLLSASLAATLAFFSLALHFSTHCIWFPFYSCF